MNIDLNSVYLFLLVSCRMAGVIFFNPIFGRQNIPVMIKVGLSLGMAFYTVSSLPPFPVADGSTLLFLLSMVKEFAVGYALGFVIQLFLSTLHVGGELVDLQMGISMARMYDPSSNSQISISGNLLTMMYTMLFFITNSHANLLALAMNSYLVIPLGFQHIHPQIGIFIAELFGYILVYAVQLALPFIVMEIILEVAVGIMMRVVPNINVFVVNLQLKLMVGLTVMATVIPLMVGFLQKLNGVMLERLHEVLQYFA